MTNKEIHENVVHMYPKVLPTYTTVKKWATEFKWSKDCTENDPQPGKPNNPNNDLQLYST